MNRLFRVLQQSVSAVHEGRLLRRATQFGAEAKSRLVASSAELVLTENCVRRLHEVLAPDEYLRVMVDSGGCSGYEYKFEIVKQFDAVDDHVFSNKNARVVIDSTSLELMHGATLDFQNELIRSAFRIVKNPNASKGCSCGSSFALKDEQL
ncbi:unnamed protein product [Soboliphyme baturini]|uniref:Iron-sulfur cluster assembly 2 homolog, mitochondrial n=1 Tax=Soboliphyme baturini TaxID=241478 RepID=A0A183IMY0_9BILA|nr:unnamed protein product [Soboliphyme baturini]